MSEAPLLSASELSKTFGVKPLFTGITLAVSVGERIALIGPNGSGKSTLLRILAGLEDPDSGFVRSRNGIHSYYVPQEDVFDESLTIVETLEKSLVDNGHDEHEVHGKIEKMCGKVGFPDKDAKVSTLSGGWKKRLAISRALILEPELLLLDEPTNHLDIAGILWLEEILSRAPYSILFVSHDRYFIENLAQRVVEVNRRYPRGFFASSGGYGDFLESREEFLSGLQQTKDSLANRVRREVEWLRQGAKARTTKSKYRSEQAGVLMDELKSYNLDERKVNIEFASSGRRSKDLIKIEKISKSINGRVLFKDISIILTPGSKLGIVGNNGSGKTTFLKTLLGDVKPDTGSVTLANKLRLSFFDQARRQLDLSITLKDALCKDGDSVIFNGKSIHVAGWAERFLFSRDHLALPLSALSGGEQARVLLAKLMLEETDILLFDEPTNDLDIKTLEVLEESFNEYPGAIVLITHDRYMLDRVANIVLGVGPEANGLYGDYLQWETAHKNARVASPGQRRKLNSEEKKELETIEKNIVKAEKLVEKFQMESSLPEIASNASALMECCKKLVEQQKLVENLYNRWEELEKLKLNLKQN